MTTISQPANLPSNVPQVATASAITAPSAAIDKLIAATESEETSLYTYLFVGVLVVALCALLYYGYNRFVTGSIKEPMTKGVKQTRDDPVVDFNLRETLKELQNTQKRVIATLSDVADI